MCKAEVLDRTCTNNNGINTFSSALKNKFKSGGVYPLIFSAFGKSDIQAAKLIMKCKSYAAEKAENSDLPPLNLGEKGVFIM